jgi:IS5 family transposase
VKEAVVDLGYRSVDADNPGVNIVHRGRIKSMSKRQRKQLKRRQAIEPVIGHVKHDNRMLRCHLKDSTGDALHAIACAAGYNLRWLMRAMRRLGLKGLFALIGLIVLCRALPGSVKRIGVNRSALIRSRDANTADAVSPLGGILNGCWV